jgi:hypothetical protein
MTCLEPPACPSLSLIAGSCQLGVSVHKIVNIYIYKERKNLQPGGVTLQSGAGPPIPFVLVAVLLCVLVV